MKKLTKMAMGAAVIVLLAATLQPAQAACSAPNLLDTLGAYLVSNPNWGGVGGSATCAPYGFGCYDSESGPPVSANFDGVFWGVGNGVSGANPLFQLGVDNGSWGADRWHKQASYPFDPGGLYHYPAWLTLPDGPNYVSGNPANWSFPVDGCVTTLTSPICTCILITDEWNGQGYFAVISANGDAGQNFNIAPTDGSGVYRLAPMPTPEVVASARDAATADVTFNVNVAGPGTAGNYQNQCDCGLQFQVYQQITNRVGNAPTSREACTPERVQLAQDDPGFAAACATAGLSWIPAQAAGGGTQVPTPWTGARASTSVTVDCDPTAEQNVYLATALAGPNGMTAPLVSGNSFRVACGANLAEPARPDRGRSGDAPRGPGNNRGRDRQQ